VNLAVHFIRARSSLILSCSSGSFFFYITLLVGGKEGGGKEENCEWRERREMREIDQSSITGKIVLHILFML